MTDARSCIFCRIARGDAPAFVVWEDETHVAFLDARPITPGHLLVVPRSHVPWVEDLTPDAHARLFAVVRRLARPVAAAAGAPHAGIAVEGYGVAHAHVHLVPVQKAGDLDPCRQGPADRAALAQAADRLRRALAAAPPETPASPRPSGRVSPRREAP